MAEFTILGPLVLGIIIGFIEMYFVHKDEAGLGWLGHGLHAIPIMFVFVFISMNLHWALQFIPNLTLTPIMIIAARLVLGLIAGIVIKTKAAIIKGQGEHLSHAIIIGILIAASPYAWEYAIAPLIGDKIPFLQ